MKKNILKFAVFLLIIMGGILPLVSYGQTNQRTYQNPLDPTVKTTSTPAFDAWVDKQFTSSQPSVIQNPIAANNLQCLVLQIFKLVINVLAFVCVGYILWAGFLFVKAQGNESELTAAKNTLRNAVIGTALIMGAWVFAEIITRTVNQIIGSNNPVSINQNQC